MITRNMLIIVLAVLVGAGCAPKMGRDINKSSVSAIERGVTTKAQVRQNLGEPNSVTTTSTGEIWSYRYMQGMNYGDLGSLSGDARLRRSPQDANRHFRWRPRQGLLIHGEQVAQHLLVLNTPFRQLSHPFRPHSTWLIFL